MRRASADAAGSDFVCVTDEARSRRRASLLVQAPPRRETVVMSRTIHRTAVEYWGHARFGQPCDTGSVNENVAPSPGVLSTQMRPPWPSTMPRAM